LPRQAEAEVGVFVNSLEAACAKAERGGWVSLEDITADMHRIISRIAEQLEQVGCGANGHTGCTCAAFVARSASLAGFKSGPSSPMVWPWKA
jgi:hypothetical protein